MEARMDITAQEKAAILTRAETDFVYFTGKIFPIGFKRFVGGGHIERTCQLLQDNRKTARISAKDHFKSTSLYAHFMWRLLFSQWEDIEAHYFSYQGSMAAYHISNIKALIMRNHFFSDLKDMKQTAESIIKFTWDGRHHVTLHPHGLLAFKRGIHCPIVYVDDPFQDPENKLNLTVVKKINNIFSTQIMDMPFQDGELHVVGTPQTNSDFFFDRSLMARFEVRIMPAIISETEKKVLWPEWMSYEELTRRRSERTERIFNQEYMCSPTYTEDAYFRRDKIEGPDGAMDPRLENMASLKTKNTVVLAWDLGKKHHPSSISAFEIEGNIYVQRFQRFLDGWEYTDQLSLVNDLMKNLSVDYGYFDNTRGELETQIEQRKIHPKLKPVVFTSKTKYDMATQFDMRVSRKRIRLLDDRRMIDSILSVTNDLQAVETPEGHGDAFWSIAMCFTQGSTFAFEFLD